MPHAASALKPILRSQFHAALSMLRGCVAACPPEHWDAPIARYPFWHVAYHTLCFVDCYLSPGDAAWHPHPRFHPAGRAELEEEHPSRRFTQAELLSYADHCRAALDGVLGEGASSETDRSLASPSGFPWLPFSRAELHLYNIRHIQHHAGQLSACLRRAGVDTPWVKAGPPS